MQSAIVRMTELQQAHCVLNGIGDLETPIHVKAASFILQRNEALELDTRLLMAVAKKVAELEEVEKDKDAYTCWFVSYLNMLPTDPYEALAYDRVIERLIVLTRLN